MPGLMLRFFATALLLVITPTLAPVSSRSTRADEPSAQEAAEVEAGHSMHGEAFNEGPRQAAYLMEGMGNIQFDISTSQPLAKKFFNQGVAQLHGFWYYEAERSFRQAAMLDPDCAMCYWGMALANVNNRKRADGFIAKAVERIKRMERISPLVINAQKVAVTVEHSGVAASGVLDRKAQGCQIAPRTNNGQIIKHGAQEFSFHQ